VAGRPRLPVLGIGTAGIFTARQGGPFLSETGRPLLSPRLCEDGGNDPRPLRRPDRKRNRS
jgi:hypothetical protein